MSVVRVRVCGGGGVWVGAVVRVRAVVPVRACYDVERGLNERRWGWDEAGTHHNIRLSNDGLSAKCHLSTYCPVRGSRGTTSLSLSRSFKP